jgi:hypothetical protein
MDLKEIGTNTRIWVGSAQGRDYRRALVNVALNAPGSISHGLKTQSKDDSMIYFYMLSGLTALQANTFFQKYYK